MKFKDINWVDLFVYFIYPIAMIGFIIMIFVEGCEDLRPRNELTKPDVVVTRDTVVDTIPFYMPVPRDSVVVRYVKKKVSLQKLDSTVVLKDSDSVNMTADSTVRIPITQRHYVDTTYEAWVSGFQPSLDSIRIFRQQLTVTKTITERKRWSYGLQGGIYLTPRGLQPGIGVGVTYTFPP